MRVKQAKTVARQWVLAEGQQIPGFGGAFFHGSILTLTENAELPATSDVDVMVVLDGSEPPLKPGKFWYQGVLLEVSYMPLARLQSPESLLADYQLASSWRAPGIILDPTGQLTRTQQAVGPEFAQRQWVRQRCQHVRQRLEHDLAGVSSATRPHHPVLAWLFGVGKLPHLLLVAGLENPTVRRRYAAARDLLVTYDRLAAHELLLTALGCDQMTRPQVAQHLAVLPAVFDAAQAIEDAPFFFASDISPAGRALAIDGSQELIDAGLHREAVFWIAATYARCMLVLDHAAAETQPYAPGYQHLLADLGIGSAVDRQRQIDRVRPQLPQVWAVAEFILAANPAIVDP
jgi:hypothetical protein